MLSTSDLLVRRVRYGGGGGIAGALNTGIERASGEYIARIDADDIATADRLETQVDILDSHPDIGVPGVATKGSTNQEPATVRLPRPAIQWQLLLTSCIPHPTAMIRRSILEETGIRYRPEFNAAEDYDFWVRLAEHTTIRNLSQPLERYRVEGDRKSERDSKRQKTVADGIALRTIERWVPEVTFSQREVHDMKHLLYHGVSESVDKRETVANVLELYRAFEYELTEGTETGVIRNDVPVTAARGILRSPVQTNSLSYLCRLLVLSPGYPLSLLRFLLRRRTRFGNG